MASPLFDMLSDLAKHPQKLDDFKSDPGAVMDDYQIDPATQALVKSSLEDGKHHDFLKAIGDEAHEQFSDPDMMLC